jgi:hypothetical protein
LVSIPYTVTTFAIAPHGSDVINKAVYSPKEEDILMRN